MLYINTYDMAAVLMSKSIKPGNPLKLTTAVTYKYNIFKEKKLAVKLR